MGIEFYTTPAVDYYEAIKLLTGMLTIEKGHYVGPSASLVSFDRQYVIQAFRENRDKTIYRDIGVEGSITFEKFGMGRCSRSFVEYIGKILNTEIYSESGGKVSDPNDPRIQSQFGRYTNL